MERFENWVDELAYVASSELRIVTERAHGLCVGLGLSILIK